jgi:hypothetical protein
MNKHRFGSTLTRADDVEITVVIKIGEDGILG